MFEDNSWKVLQELEKALNKGFFAVGEEWLKNATITMSNMGIVDTGRARASLSFLTPAKNGGNAQVGASGANDRLSGTAPKNSIIVGGNVSYLNYIVSGTSRMAARDFFTPSLMTYANEYKQLFEMCLKGEL